MRQPFRAQYYDGVMNMFTSFGYFQQEREHRRTLRNVSNSLEDFQELFAVAGLHIYQNYGDYELGKFVPGTPPRLILMASKPGTA